MGFDLNQQVLRYVGNYDKNPTLHKIHKVTETQVTLDNGERFTRRESKRIGDNKWSSNAVWIRDANPETLEWLQKSEDERKAIEKRREWLKRRADAMGWHIRYRMTEEQQDTLYAYLRELGMSEFIS